METEVDIWLAKCDLSELVERFKGQKVNSFRRVHGLTEDMLKELIPEVGLRAEFLECRAELNSATGEINQVSQPVYVIQNQSEILTISAASEASKQTTEVEESDQNSSWIDFGDLSVSETADSGCSLSLEDCSSGTTSRPSTPEVAPAEPKAGPSTESARSCTSSSAAVAGPSCSNISSKRKRSNASSVQDSQPKHLKSWQAKEYIKSLDLRGKIEDDPIAYAVLRQYEKNGIITDKDRGTIALLCMRDLIAANHFPSAEEYELMVSKIIEIFPFESAITWFRPPAGQRKNSAGKLPHIVKNTKYKINKKGAGPLPTIPFTSGSVSNKSGVTKPAKLSGSTDRNDQDLRASIVALKHRSTDSWPEILKHWSNTHAFRFKYLRETRPGQQSNDGVETEDNLPLVNTYIEEYNILKASNGHLLICQDFNELYPGREQALLGQWDSWKSLFVSLVRQEVSKTDLVTKKLLDDITNAPAGRDDMLIISLLPSLCCKAGRGQKLAERVLPVDARKSLFLHVKIPGDFHREVENYRRSLLSQGQRLQPFIVVVGPTLVEVNACYVQIDKVHYKLPTPLGALDTCFKAYFALDAAYPLQSYPVWLFLQHYFYGIVLPEDRHNARVTSVISSLKAMASRAL